MHANFPDGDDDPDIDAPHHRWRLLVHRCVNL
jgi:hypothetical protein